MRLLALLASVLACTSTSLVSACPIGLNIGASSGASDVINNCQTVSPWNGGSTPNNINPAVHGLNFYARSPTLQTYSITFTADAEVVVPIARSGGTGTLQPNVQSVIFIDLPCVNADGVIRQADVTVTISFTDPFSSGVSFQFHKICELPPINIGSPGPAGDDPDIAVLGVARSDFNYTSTADVQSDAFYFWIPENPPFLYWPYFNFSEQPVVRWNNKDLISNVGGVLSSSSILPNTTTNPLTRLTVSYTCTGAFTGSDTIYVIIDVGFLTKLQFQYTKNCSLSQSSGPAIMFNAQLVRTGEYAISSGVVQGDWSKGIGQNIPQNEHEVDFSVFITGPTKTGANELPFNVTAIVTNGGSHMMINDGSTVPVPFTAKMKAAVDVKVPLEITCLTTGEGTGTVIFDFGSQYDASVIHFQYFCSQPYFNIDFMSQDGQTVIQRIVEKNVKQPWNYVSPDANNQERFLVSLHPDTAYGVQDITFDKISYMNHAINPIVYPYKAWMPLNKTNPIPAMIVFNCVDRSTYTNTPVSIQLDYGWNVVQQIAFYKECGIPPSSSSSGWSAAGIFFFTIFILTLVGCVTGAGYKYVKEEKRGWEVVPGITYYRSCYENVCPSKRYTPQTDYYTDNVPDHGGKSYQTDL